MPPRLEDIRCFVLDMDGTFYLGERIFPGALRFAEVLERQGKDYVFLTNNSSNDAAAWAGKLTRLGFPTDPSRVMTSGAAAVEILRREQPGARVDLFGTPPLRREFEQGGLQLVESDPDLVVLGFDQTLDYPKIRRLCDHVRAGVPYWATHPDVNCPTEGGFLPDTGAMIEMVAASAGRRPDRIIGKPHPDIVRAIFARTGRAPEELAVCGDRLHTDVATGLNAGVLAVLVLSGVTKRADLEGAERPPHLVVEDLGELADRLEGAGRRAGGPVGNKGSRAEPGRFCDRA